WIYERDGGVRQFTYSAKSESTPRWSPDGKQLAFLSNREEDQQQVFVIPADGGEARSLTKGKRGVRSFAWSPDGKQIAYLAPDAKTEEEEKKDKDKDDARVVDKEDKRARLWVMDVGKGEPRALSKPGWQVEEVAWMPVGDQVVVKAQAHPE